MKKVILINALDMTVMSSLALQTSQVLGQNYLLKVVS